MSPAVKLFLQRWIINTLAVLVAANIVKGISYENHLALVVASLLLGVLNTFLRPVMLLLSLPLLIFTLGLFTLVINACLLYAVGAMMKSFAVDTFGAAFWGALVISIVSLVVNTLLGTNRIKVETKRSRESDRNDQNRPPDGGNGPVIDV